MAKDNTQADFKEIIRDIFNTVATGYDNPAMRYFPCTADHIINLLQPVRGNKLLDIATGTGMVAISAAQAIRPDGRVQAIDFACNMLSKAEYNARKHGLVNIDFQEMDAEKLEFPSNFFDYITCSFGVFFLSDPDAVVKSWLPVLKHGGKLMITTFARNAFKPLTDLFRKNFEELGSTYPETDWQRFAKAEDCESFLANAGYTEVKVTTKQMGYHITSEQDWWEIVCNSGMRGLVEMLDPEQQVQFKTNHLEEVASLKTDKGIWLDVEVIFTQGNRI